MTNILANKKSVALTICCLVSLFFHCVLNESLRARKLLANCKVTLKQIDLKVMEFLPIITFDKSKRKVNVDKPKIEDLVPLAQEIKAKKFKLKISKLEFIATISIDNPNNQEVILDSMMFYTYLDNAYLMKVHHDKYTIVLQKSSKNTKITIDVPVKIPLQAIREAEFVILKGTVWLRLNFTKKVVVTLPINLTLKRKIPREKINKKIDTEKNRVKKILLKEAEMRLDQKIEKNEPVKKIKKIIKGLFQ